MAQREGFEPSSGFSRYTISNRARYDLFDTAAYYKPIAELQCYSYHSAVRGNKSYYSRFFPVVK